MRRKGILLLVPVLLLSALAGASHRTFSAFSAVTANVGSQLSAAAASCSGTLNTPTFLTGFEHGVLSDRGGGTGGLGSYGLFTYITPGASIDTSVVRTGTYSMRAVKTNGAYAEVDAGIGDAGATVLSVRFYIRLPSVPTVANRMFAVEPTANQRRASLGYDTATNKWKMWWYKESHGTPGVSAQLSSGTVSLNTWYRIDMKVDFGATSNTIDWQVDGVAQTRSTNNESATTAIDSALWIGSDNDPDVFEAYYDDVAATANGTSYPIGAGGVSAVVPTAMGTSSDAAARLQDDDSSAWDANTYTRVRDIPISGVADYVKQVTAGASYLEFALGDAGAVCVLAVRGIVALQSTTTSANNAGTMINDSGTDRTVWSGTISSTSRIYKGAIIAPASGNWTTANFNAPPPGSATPPTSAHSRTGTPSSSNTPGASARLAGQRRWVRSRYVRASGHPGCRRPVPGRAEAQAGAGGAAPPPRSTPPPGGSAPTTPASRSTRCAAGCTRRRGRPAPRHRGRLPPRPRAELCRVAEADRPRRDQELKPGGSRIGVRVGAGGRRSGRRPARSSRSGARRPGRRRCRRGSTRGRRSGPSSPGGSGTARARRRSGAGRRASGRNSAISRPGQVVGDLGRACAFAARAGRVLHQQVVAEERARTRAAPR